MKYPNFQIPATVEYLSEVISELPHNCMYDKSITGAGGTYIALTSQDNYIICVPYVSLIENKCFQHKEVFGVYEGTKISDLKVYLANEAIPVKKIMVTYDSIEKILRYIDPSEYKLLVDELHCLFQQYLFRNDAVMKVLNNYDKFKSFCFMTATMIEPQFTLKELKHLPVYEADWEIVKKVNVISTKCDADVKHTIAYLIDEFLTGVETGNAHIFINSVDTIKALINHSKLTNENCRGIWSKHNKTDMPIERNCINDDVKKINFYTSACFEGTDVKDEDGKIFIVSDGTKAHSTLDITTSFKQIAGRIRDSKYKDTIHHIYSSTRYENYSTYEDYQKYANELILEDIKEVEDLNNLNDKTKKKILKVYTSLFKNGASSYIRTTNDSFIYEENLYKLDLYNYKVTRQLYSLKLNMAKEYKKINMNYEEWETDKTQLDKKHIVKISPKANFTETVLEIETKKDSDFILWAYKKYPFLSDAIKYLGFKKIKDLKYNITNIKKTIISTKHSKPEHQVKDLLILTNKFKKGSYLLVNELKELLQTTYDKCGFEKKAKATDIEQYFTIKKTTKKIDNRPENVYVIMQ